jgi:AraC family transcriptional regulator
MTTSIVYLRPVSVLAVCARGPYATSVAKAWDLMSDWLRTSGALDDVTPRYGLLLDDPRVTAPSECRYEACIPLPAKLGPLPQDFSVKRLPYGAFARAHHVSGKIGIARTISTLRADWTPQHGLVLDSIRPLIEIYLDKRSDMPGEPQRIDVCLPVMFPADPSPSGVQ